MKMNSDCGWLDTAWPMPRHELRPQMADTTVQSEGVWHSCRMTTPQHVIVTGANRGLGLVLTTKLVARGDQVTATVRALPIAASSVLATFQALHPTRLQIHACDMTKPESIGAFATAMQAHAITGLINNAGVWGDHQRADVACSNSSTPLMPEAVDNFFHIAAARCRGDRWAY